VIARERGTDGTGAAMDLISSDRFRVSVAFLSMAEESLRTALRRLWVCSDGASMAPEGTARHSS